MSYSPRRYSGNGLCTLLFKAQLFSLVASPLWRTQQRFTVSKQIWVREKLTRSIAEKQPTFGWSEALSTSRLSCSLTWRYCKTPTIWHPSQSFWTSFQPCHSWVFSTRSTRTNPRICSSISTILGTTLSTCFAPSSSWWRCGQSTTFSSSSLQLTNRMRTELICTKRRMKTQRLTSRTSRRDSISSKSSRGRQWGAQSTLCP